MLKLKDEFIKRYKEILGDEIDIFISYLEKPLQKTIRVNTWKIDGKKLKELLKEEGIKIDQLPFYKDGFIVKSEVEALGSSIYHQLGYFYIQEKASMLPVLFMELSNEKKELILDIAASPGSKTTQASQEAKNSLIVANDVSEERVNILISNCRRLGNVNVIVTKRDGRWFSRFANCFDKVLLDAPCSSDGAIRKDWSIAKNWSLKMVKRLSKLQKQLIEASFTCLKRGGVLIYSTCTLAPEEDEEVVNYLINKYDNAIIEEIKLKNFKFREGLTYFSNKKFSDELEKTARIYPQDNDSESFYIAKIRKI